MLALTCVVFFRIVVRHPDASTLALSNFVISSSDAGGLGGLNVIYVQIKHKRRHGILKRGGICSEIIES